MSFTYVTPGCSWYEHHMLGGCQRPAPRPECLPPPHKRYESSARRAKERLAVIIPYRGKVEPESFAPLCERLPSHLRRHGVKFHLLAVNQADAHPFNRAALTNAAVAMLDAGGARVGLRPDQPRFDCLAVHDVDRFPVDPSANTSCAPHVATYYTCRGAAPRVLHPTSFTGGVLLIRPELFRNVNGFSNQFWGWGHEDNELFVRLRSCGMRPKHAPEVESCMEHRDCEQCKRAKPTKTLDAMRAETANIELVQRQLAHPERHQASDGVRTLNFSAAARPRSMAFGGHTLHATDVWLHRESHQPSRVCSPASRGGGGEDEGCVEQMPTEELPEALLARARQALPAGARFTRVLRATRERAFYNLHYELDVEAEDRHGSVLFRVAVCAQEWRRGVAAAGRYQPLWRAIAKSRASSRTSTATGSKGTDAPPRFRLHKDFGWGGHFPCSLRHPPWARRQHERAPAAL